jgi:hypothetical protein
MYALRGNTYLERLNLVTIDDSQEAQALVSVLLQNKGLVHLTVALDDIGLGRAFGGYFCTPFTMFSRL